MLRLEYRTCYEYIKNRHCVDYTISNFGYTDIYSGIDRAIRRLGTKGRDANPAAVKKIIVISDCENTPNEDSPDIEDICDEDMIEDIKNGGIDVMFINLGASIDSEYGSCLATPDNVYNPDFDSYSDIYEFVNTISEDICLDPTESPTSDPTVDPTADPTRSNSTY